MAVQTNAHTVSFPAGTDFSATGLNLTRGRFVEVRTASSGFAVATLCRDTQRADGVMLNAPPLLGAAEVMVGAGKVGIEAGGVIAQFALVASDILGRAVASTVYAGEVILGRALEAAGAAGEEITILYFGAGGGGTD